MIDYRTVNIDNEPPDTSVVPRDRSVRNVAPDAILANVVDGGATEGADEADTYIETARGGIPLECACSNGENQIRLVPSSWADGVYTATVVPKDMTGNIGKAVTSTFTLDRSIQGGPTS
ncbi:MAG: hypothetical protein ACM3X3_05635 [Betaproteobacteria bacterium]